MASLNPEGSPLSNLGDTIDLLLRVNSEAKTNPDTPNAHSKLKDIFYEKVTRIAEKIDEPFIRRTLNKALKELKQYEDDEIGSLPQDAIEAIKTVRNIFFKTGAAAYIPPSLDDEDDEEITEDLSLEEVFDEEATRVSSTTDSGYTTPEKMSRAEKQAIIDRLLEFPANQGITPDSIVRQNRAYITALHEKFRFTGSTQLEGISILSEMLSPTDQDLAPDALAPTAYPNCPNQFRKDYIPPRLPFITISLTPFSEISPQTELEGIALIGMVREFIERSGICPEGTPQELRQKVENTILYAISQNTLNASLGMYIHVMTSLEMPFRITPSEGDFILSPVIDPDHGTVIPCAFTLDFLISAAHRYDLYQGSIDPFILDIVN